MTDEYTPERIAATRAILRQIEDNRRRIGPQFDSYRLKVDIETAGELGAALDALEAAQAKVTLVRECLGQAQTERDTWRKRSEAAEATIRELTAKLDWESEFNATLIRDNAHIGQREAEYAKRAEVAEVEIARLTGENASLLRRIEGLRLAVWGDRKDAELTADADH